jgi:hypothetical protein
MLTYECFVVYALKIGVERVGKPGSFERARAAIESHFHKHAWFDSRAYGLIWRDLDTFMSAPLDLSEQETPIGKLLLTALTLFSMDREPVAGLKSHLMFELQAIADFAEKTTGYMLQMANE